MSKVKEAPRPRLTPLTASTTSHSDGSRIVFFPALPTRPFPAVITSFSSL